MSENPPQGIYLTAQKYKLRHRIRPAALGRWLAEKVFSQFSDKMEILASVDQQMRDVALGNNDFNISIKDALSRAKESLRTGRYVDVAYYASIVDEIVIAITLLSHEVVEQLKIVGVEYSASAVTPEAVEFFESKKQVEAQFIQKMWRALRGDPLERAYRKEIQKRKSVFSGLVLTMERYVVELMGIFDRMGIARSGGKIEDWISEYDRMIKSEPKYHAYIDKTYENHVKVLVQIAKRIKKEDEIGHQAALVWLEKIFGPVPQQSLQQEEIINVEESDIIEDKGPFQAVPVEQPVTGTPVRPVVTEPVPQKTIPSETIPQEPVRRERGRPRKEPGTLKDISEEQLEHLSEVLQYIKEEQAQTVSSVIEMVLQTGGEDEIIQTTQGDILAQVQDGTITFFDIEDDNGQNVQIPVPMAFKALQQMQVAGLLPPASSYISGHVQETLKVTPIVEQSAPRKRGLPKKQLEEDKPVVLRQTPGAKEQTSKPSDEIPLEKPKIKPGPRKLKPQNPGQRKGLLVAVNNPKIMRRMREDPKVKRRVLDEVKKIYLNRHPEVEDEFTVYAAPPDQIQTEVERYQKRGTYDENILDVTDYDELFSVPDISSKVSLDHVDKAVLKLSNKHFYQKLQRTAKFNDPYLMATLMLQYSKKIEDADPNLSIKLLAHAREIING